MIFTKNEFRTALKYSRPGQEIVYHTGLLMRDRQLDKDVELLARSVWDMFEIGEIELFQRRITPKTCDYIAVKVPHKKDPVEWTGCYLKARGFSWQKRHGRVPSLTKA